MRKPIQETPNIMEIKLNFLDNIAGSNDLHNSYSKYTRIIGEIGDITKGIDVSNTVLGEDIGLTRDDIMNIAIVEAFTDLLYNKRNLEEEFFINQKSIKFYLLAFVREVWIEQALVIGNKSDVEHDLSAVIGMISKVYAFIIATKLRVIVPLALRKANINYNTFTGTDENRRQIEGCILDSQIIPEMGNINSVSFRNYTLSILTLLSARDLSELGEYQSSFPVQTQILKSDYIAELVESNIARQAGLSSEEMHLEESCATIDLSMFSGSWDLLYADKSVVYKYGMNPIVTLGEPSIYEPLTLTEDKINNPINLNLLIKSSVQRGTGSFEDVEYADIIEQLNFIELPIIYNKTIVCKSSVGFSEKDYEDLVNDDINREPSREDIEGFKQLMLEEDCKDINELTFTEETSVSRDIIYHNGDQFVYIPRALSNAIYELGTEAIRGIEVCDLDDIAGHDKYFISQIDNTNTITLRPINEGKKIIIDEDVIEDVSDLRISTCDNQTEMMIKIIPILQDILAATIVREEEIKFTF